MDDPFNRLPLDKAYIDKHYRHIDERGEWQSDDLTGPRTSKGESSKPWRDFDPAEHGGRCWSEPKRGEYAKYIDEVLIPGYLSVKSVHGRLDLLDKHGLIHYPTEGASKSESLPRLKRYLMPRQSRMLTNIWTDIPNLSARNKEYTNWSTQKPLPLYARMIRASSEEGNVVLDPFCGCATTCVAAEMLKRQWIGIDIDPKAEEVSKDRLRDEVDFWENSELAVAVKKNPPRRSDIEHLSYAKLRFTLWNSQAGKCANPHCSSRKKGDGTIREEDTQAVHRIPKSRGCEDDLTNRIGLCGDCNSRKSAKSWGEFLVSEYANLPIHGRM